jgi:hypothetical protein
MTILSIRTMDIPMAKKPLRYPRKLRQTIEKVEKNRQARAATGDPNASLEDNMNPLFHNFWRDFLPRGSVHTMIAEVDDVLQRISHTSYMRPPFQAKRVFARPPWVEDGASR